MSSKNHALTATRSGFAVVIAAAASAAMAVPYPSQVRNTTGSTWEFVLNQDADDVVVARDGGNELALGALTAGRYTFDLAGFSTFDITVENSLPSGLARVSDTTNIYTEFNRPAGLAINRDPSSEFFGTVYVAHSIASTRDGATFFAVVRAISSFARPVMVRKPSSSSRPRSPVCSQPSRSTWAVASGSSQ